MSKNDAVLKKARVLVLVQIDGVTYQPGDVVEVDDRALFTLRASLDAHPEAVAYAEKLNSRRRARALLEAELEAESSSLE